jgi:hypothetical protein
MWNRMRRFFFQQKFVGKVIVCKFMLNPNDTIAGAFQGKSKYPWWLLGLFIGASNSHFCSPTDTGTPSRR